MLDEKILEKTQLFIAPQPIESNLRKFFYFLYKYFLAIYKLL